MTIYCPGGKAIYQLDIDKNIATRQLIQRSVNHGGSWYSRNNYLLREADIAQIADIKNLLDRKDIKVRVEEPHIQIYAVDESVLKDIADAMTPLARSRINSVQSPRDDKQAELLRDNKILRKSRRNNYQYKIVCRDGRVDPTIKKNLLNYLESLGDTVSIPRCSRDMLANNYSGFWGVYYYSNDISINTFVDLIRPGTIANVHEIVVVK